MTFMRFGVRKTTMSEIAIAANVSRPTLYGMYSNKDELLSEVIGHWHDIAVNSILADVEHCRNLSAKLDVYFDHAILRPFDLTKFHFESSNIISDNNQIAITAFDKGQDKLKLVIETLLGPYGATLEKVGTSVSQYASFVVVTATKLQQNMDNREQLEAHLQSLKVSVLCVAGERRN